MKRNLVTIFLLIIGCMVTNTAHADNTNASDSIKGRVGITGRLGFIVPADSENITTGVAVGRSTDAGLTGGGGFIYGITDNIATELDITHSSFGSDANTDFDTTDISLGVQYRCPHVSIKHLIPYAGVGLDILVNGANNGQDVDTVAGVHAKAGVDYFVMRQLALNSEIKGVLAPNADITQPGIGKVGEFDPNSFSMTFGVRFFFN